MVEAGPSRASFTTKKSSKKAKHTKAKMVIGKRKEVDNLDEAALQYVRSLSSFSLLDLFV
jgi:hypothetical protein